MEIFLNDSTGGGYGWLCVSWPCQLLATFIVSVLLQAPKLLDLDLMNGVATEEGDSELLLKVDLQHFGEVRN